MAYSVYIETTIPSYLTAWPSRDVIRLSHQLLTKQWWTDARPRFRCLTSEIVLIEAAAGDPVAARERLAVLEGMELLELPEQAELLAGLVAERTSLPKEKAADALHIAIAAVHGIDFLLTWNCTHIANGILLPRIEAACRERGYKPPRIVTPEFLLEAP